MKKKLLLIALILLLAFVLTACDKVTVEKEEKKKPEPAKSMFVQVERSGFWHVVYDRETLVMYVVSTGYYNCGNFTMLANADGTPKLYKP